MRIRTRALFRSIFAGGPAFVLSLAASVAMAQTSVRLPFIEVDAGGGGVGVRVPFVHVYTGPGGTAVRAPFIRIDSGRFGYPYAPVEAGPPRPAVPAIVRVEVDPAAQVLIPEPRDPVPADANNGAPLPELGSPVPQLGAPVPKLGRASKLPGALVPDLGESEPLSAPPAVPPAEEKKPAPVPQKSKPNETSKRPVPTGTGGSAPATSVQRPETGPAFPSANLEGAVATNEGKGDRPAPQGKRVPRAPTVPAEAGTIQQAGGAVVPADEADVVPPPPPSFTPSYLVIPMKRGDRRPAMRVSVVPLPPPSAQRNGEILQTEAIGPAVPRRGLPPAPATPSGAAASVYELSPMWHGEVPAYFEPVEGLHLFAFIHPFTQQTVAVEVYLPAGRPTLKIDSDEVEFDYGRVEVELHFKRDGRVQVKYED